MYYNFTFLYPFGYKFYSIGCIPFGYKNWFLAISIPNQYSLLIKRIRGRYDRDNFEAHLIIG